MNTDSPWQRWRDDWASVPVPDVAALRRHVHRKHRRMVLAQVLELVITVIVSGQLVWLLAHPRYGFWSGWIWAVLAFIWSILIVGVWLRRRVWRAPSMDARSMLALTARRARLGVLFGWFNALSPPAIALLSVPMIRHMWAVGDAAQRYGLRLSAYVNLGVYALTLIICAWYVVRQHTRLRRVRTLLRELEE